MNSEFETLLSGQLFKKLYDKRCILITEKYGLHKVEIEILLFLKKGKLDTARDIVEARHYSKAHISHAIEHLMEQGYVVGQMDAQDRRCIHLKLTEEAEPVCQELIKLRRSLMKTVYKDVTEEEMLILKQVAKKVAHNINAELMNEI
ncbi:MAG: winged helix-turn-helix transcriptional regulator [Lachnospiraceae bacterium]|nr:winged helix-turn-helix transcriptional regulator [Lachnospiraceae bacterium]